MRKPHKSHIMTEWAPAIVTLIAASRFGKIRQCIHCGAEEAQTACGHAAHDELRQPCPEAGEYPCINSDD